MSNHLKTLSKRNFFNQSPSPINVQPWQSPYNSMDGNPINLTDVRGDKADGGGGKTSTGKKTRTVNPDVKSPKGKISYGDIWDRFSTFFTKLFDKDFRKELKAFKEAGVNVEIRRTRNRPRLRDAKPGVGMRIYNEDGEYEDKDILYLYSYDFSLGGGSGDTEEGGGKGALNKWKHLWKFGFSMKSPEWKSMSLPDILKDIKLNGFKIGWGFQFYLGWRTPNSLVPQFTLFEINIGNPNFNWFFIKRDWVASWLFGGHYWNTGGFNHLFNYIKSESKDPMSKRSWYFANKFFRFGFLLPITLLDMDGELTRQITKPFRTWKYLYFYPMKQVGRDGVRNQVPNIRIYGEYKKD